MLSNPLGAFKSLPRKPNTDRNGNNWTQEQILAVWRKGQVVLGHDPNQFRSDKCGFLMIFNEHGNRNANNGWEIDHINPVANGGGDDLLNLQPLHWRNNASKGDKLDWKCGQ